MTRLRLITYQLPVRRVRSYRWRCLDSNLPVGLQYSDRTETSLGAKRNQLLLSSPRAYLPDPKYKQTPCTRTLSHGVAPSQ